MSKELIRLVNCTMAFDDEVVLDNINLKIRDKEFLTLLGPSGCGKTTTLRIIGGFQTPSSGDIFFDGVRINAVPPHKRTINTVFQKYALFPHLNVYDNIAFGLRIPKAGPDGKKIKLPEEEIDQRVLEMLEIVNLKGFDKRRISQLSGGQQQRVAIARALVTKPAIILADEPTGNLDSRTTQEVLGLLKLTGEQFHQTIVMITHNEALAQLCDRIIHIEDGRIVGGRNHTGDEEVHA